MESFSSFFKEENDIFYKVGEKRGLEKGIEKGLVKAQTAFVKYLSTLHSSPSDKLISPMRK